MLLSDRSIAHHISEPCWKRGARAITEWNAAYTAGEAEHLDVSKHILPSLHNPFIELNLPLQHYSEGIAAAPEAHAILLSGRVQQDLTYTIRLSNLTLLHCCRVLSCLAPGLSGKHVWLSCCTSRLGMICWAQGSERWRSHTVKVEVIFMLPSRHAAWALFWFSILNYISWPFAGHSAQQARWCSLQTSWATKQHIGEDRWNKHHVVTSHCPWDSFSFA